MAKKAEKLGRGFKRCPECGFVNPARATVCKNCNYVFSKGAKRSRVVVKRKAGAASGDEGITEILNFIKAHGGLENAKQSVEEISQLVQKLGSIEAVADRLKLVSLIHENL